MQSVNVTVPSSVGIDLAATIDFPSGTPRAYAVFAHCFACSRQVPGAARTSKRLAEHGIATLRFDFPGLGQSGGDFADSSFSQNADDIRAVAEWLGEHYEYPQLIMGHSLGGAATLKAASEMPKVKAVATIGAPYDPWHSVLHYQDKLPEIEEKGSAVVKLGGKDLTMSRGFVNDLKEAKPEEYIRCVRKPLLVLHSPTDQTVGIENAIKILEHARFPKSLFALDKADHLMMKPGFPQRAADLIAQWVAPYLEEPELDAVSEGSVDTHTARGTRFGDVVRTASTTFESDRPKSNGGKSAGISAQELAAAAIATASSQAARVAAKGMKLDDVHVSVTATESGFERHIELVGDLDDSQRSSVLAAARATEVDKYFASGTIQDQ